MAKIDDAIATQAYILDVLMAYREISKLPTCNECKANRHCTEAPKPGQMVRYNCYAFVGEVQDEH
jgi:hypothetical protein